MVERISLGGLALEVIKKDIRNVHLGVYPPDGRVRVAVPNHMRLDTIRVYVISKLGWIKEQQRKFRSQERETNRGYTGRESHYLWGRRYLLKIVEEDVPPSVEVKPRSLVLTIRPGAGTDAKKNVMEKWRRDRIRAAVEPLLEKWERSLCVKSGKLYIQRMRTRWGSCNPATRGIRLNSELSKKPPECLEFIVVHELIHLLESRHTPRFHELMDRHMPQWRHFRGELNRSPLAYERWEY